MKNSIVLKKLIQLEETTHMFWTRCSDNTIAIWCRPTERCCKEQWPLAWDIVEFFKGRVLEGPKPDPQSGCVLIKIRGIEA